jgi:hypothetical protein
VYTLEVNNISVHTSMTAENRQNNKTEQVKKNKNKEKKDVS